MTDDNMNREDQDLSDLSNTDGESKDDWKVDPKDIAFAERASQLGTIPAATFQEPTVTDTQTGWGDDADLLPPGAGGPARDEWDNEEEEIDLSDLRINLSAQEAAAESFEDLVAGKYRVAIIAGKVERSKSAKNPGKPMYSLTYKVQDGKHKGAQMYDRLCLWSGAAYSYVMLVKALGYKVAEGSIPVVPIKDLIGRTFIVRYGMGKANTVKDPITGEEKKYEARLQVKGYFADGASSGVNATSFVPDPLAP